MTERFKQTEVGHIPVEWQILKISDIAVILTGSTPSIANKSNYGDEFMFVTPADLGRTRSIINTERKLSASGFSQTRKFPANSILFTCIGSTIGKSGIALKPLTSNQQINAILPNNSYNSDYLYYILSFYSEKIKQSAGETAVPIINKTDFGNIKIPLPPTKAEQTAIATILSDADALITSLERLIAKKKAIKQGAMQELLKPKEGWTVKSLNELFIFLSTSNCSRADLNEEDGIGYIHYGDIHTKWKVFLDCSKNKIPFIQPSKVKNVTLLQDGDLVIADASEDYEGLGECIEIREIGNKKIVAGLHTLLLRCKFNELIKGFRGYFKFYFGIQQSLILNATGVSVYGISKSNLKNFNIYLPPIEEQIRIAQILSDMDAEITRLEKKLEKQKLIKQGMMQVLLTGKVRLL